ncbi:hypothetical protein BDW67DRAFT_150897, partial [Aspergillus spinulosporus]
MTSRCGRASPGSIPGGAIAFLFFLPPGHFSYGAVYAHSPWYFLILCKCLLPLLNITLHPAVEALYTCRYLFLFNSS